ncbi:MAG: hypothetical protein HC932_02650 [Thermales bacterium]|nr:hypothetical protein [Thermales bacterium]
MSNKKIILVDGTNLAFRMYFALSRAGLTAKDGRPSGAVYGFVKLIIETIFKEKPDNIIIAWDPKGGTFRDKKFAFYKATRPTEIPEDLLEQFPQIQRGMDSLGIPQLTIKLIEADDIIGTIATQLKPKNYDIKILSGDKDLFQLVGGNIKSLYPSARKGTEVLDSTGIKAKLGVLPEQVVDYKALAGDSSDNIPGVKGIGTKGAINLLEEYSSLDGVYKNINKIKSISVQKKLQEGFQSAQDSKWLATIKTDVDLNYDLNQPLYNPNLKALEEFFNEYNFTTIREIF